MSALILHLTDIHIANEKDFILERHEEIASCLNAHLPTASIIFIAVTGDIAMSGKKTEYDLAHKFLSKICSYINKQRNDIPIEFIIVPGNHDCDFSGNQIIRNLIVKDVLNHVGSIPEEIIEGASAPQKEFFIFRNNLINLDSLAQDEKLWTVQEFEVEGKRIWFDSLNASWMSTIHEKPGVVIFPFESYTNFKSTDADLRIGLIHHPLNWYNQINYQGLKSFIHTLEDIFISGHEHSGNSSFCTDAKNGECIFIEGSALQSHKNSGFNILLLDVENGTFSCEKYDYLEKSYERQNESIWLPIRPLPNRIRNDLQITANFIDILTDPGATLNHPDKPNLKLNDFYVFPDLDTQFSDKKTNGRRGSLSKKKSARSLTLPESIEKNIILEGDENSGKTRLLYQIFSSFHTKDYLPLFIDGRKIKSSQEKDFRKIINASISEQYGKENIQAFEKFDIGKKILLIDDFDQSPLQDKWKSELLLYISKAFGFSVLSVGENFRMNEIFSSDKIESLANYSHYRILPFGYERRGDIVRKWKRLGINEMTPNNDWLSACTQAEKLIEAARLQHVATTVPIMVLSLLNLGTSGITKEMHNSSFAHYFYFLIVGALSKTGIRQEALAKFLGFSTHLSWFVKHHGVDLEITENQFNQFCESYSQTWTKVSPVEMLSTLTKSRVLKHHGDSIRFTYQYSYYYFLGRYTNLFMEDDDVKSYLTYCMKNLYVRECANTLLFLAHHSENGYVLEGVCAALHEHLVGISPATFSKDDISVISGLISSAPSLVYEKKDPVAHRTEVEKFQDDHDNGDDGLFDEPMPKERKRDFVDEITSISKTIEIAGALVTNQYASLSRDKKNYSINLIFNSSLKVIRGFFDLIGREPERLIKEISTKVKSRGKNLTTHESEEITRHSIAWILKIVSMAFVEKAGQHLSSPDLSDNVDEVIHNNPTLAMQLIKVSQLLSTSNRLPQATIKSIIKTEKDNPCVMSILQIMILKRLYMFDTDHDDKDWAISTFKLDGTGTKIDFSERQRRLATRAA